MDLVILGAGGKLARLLRPVFPQKARWLTRADVDILDTAALRVALRGADVVICMAGVTNASAQPLHMNTDIAVRTLDAAQEVSAGRVILLSSAAVYGGTAGICAEDGPTAPYSEYGKAKLAMESAAAQHPHPNTVLRLGNVAGADAILAGWVPGFRLDQLPDGSTPCRSYIGPNALARTLSALSEAPALPPRLNVAAPGCIQMGALLDAACLEWRPKPATAATIPTVNLDTTRLRTFTEFKAADSTPIGIVEDWQNR